MQKETSSLLKLGAITAVILLVVGFTMGKGAYVINFYDTYYVFDAFSKVIVIILFSSFIASLSASIFTKFKIRIYIKALFFSLFLIFCFGMYIFSMFFAKH
jgi:hypothetical protein